MTNPVKRYADTLYHDILSSAETLLARQRAVKFADTSIASIAARIANGDEVEDGFPRDAFDAMSAEGLFRIPFSSAVGGDGLQRPASATAAVVEELAYHSNSVAAIYDVHCILAGHALESGTPEQQQRWLAPIVSGEIIGAFATSEPGSSSDLSPTAVQTRAERTAEGWVLNGRKRWITNSPIAGVIVILARTGNRLSLFIVDPRTPGVTIGRADRKMGNRGQLTADVHLADVRVDDSDLLGSEGGGLKIALSTLTYGRIGIGAAGVGMAQAAFDQAAAWLATRHAFGGPLAAKQHWQFLMANRALELESARSLYIKAALRLDNGTPFPEPEAAMAKIAGTKLAVDIARDAVQALGGIGFSRELGADSTTSGVEAIYRDSKIGEIYEGANEVQQWVIARHIFGRDITG